MASYNNCYGNTAYSILGGRISELIMDLQCLTSVDQRENIRRTVLYYETKDNTIQAEILANIIFGDLLRKCCWQDLKLADFSSVWRKTHACSINRSIMV